ncbi:MAG: D-glycero-beta-D-manno-heptose-1,7-bisphosphate 7-phosphatase [Firmicutes bacterium ADurb.Bin419]|mgnify:CR=1 FL=1|nr:MAG: D-glycero-beta-D-manno-heptose-1,7-bisphosphate 7-phosphatase [Firmicutes bacterium ADurb.Bin419]
MEELFPAIFIDRDGVICKEKSYITSWEQMEIYPFAKEAVRRLRDAGFKTIIVTNQSAVGRGMMREETLKQINEYLQQIIPIDGLYYCPHYPPEKEEILPYRINCSCRKPKAGMIYTARDEHKIDLSKSYIVGDRSSDILAGKNASVKTVLVRTGYGITPETDINPDYVFNDLMEFTEFIL